ncbi:MAG: hypothetical protein AAF558_08990 [Verrucomicrobiota bacterium]
MTCMKAFFKKQIKRLGHHLVVGHLNDRFEAYASSREAQLVLSLAYQNQASDGKVLPSFDQATVRAFSQTNEDGILLLITSVLGRGNGRIVEIGCGNGEESNSANLLVNHGWHGWLFDGSKEGIVAADRFFQNCRDTRHHPPLIRQAWITRKNINQLLEDAGVPSEIDVFSLDIDGMDYWVWEALTFVRPRIVVLEYNNIIPADLSITVPYEDSFSVQTQGYMGASLRALVDLSKKKGYRLIGCNKYGYNAFFIREDDGLPHFPDVSVEACLDFPHCRNDQRSVFEPIRDMPWESV